MKLSTRSRYGTRLILDIAENGNGRPVPVSDISKRMGVSVKYLEQLIRPLNKGSFLKSVRGPRGGHLLAEPAEKIAIGDVVRLLEGDLGLTECVDRPSACPLSGQCRTRRLWTDAARALNEVLDNVTLAGLKNYGR
jgi:Rrf2 family protein